MTKNYLKIISRNQNKSIWWDSLIIHKKSFYKQSNLKM